MKIVSPAYGRLKMTKVLVRASSLLMAADQDTKLIQGEFFDANENKHTKKVCCHTVKKPVSILEVLQFRHFIALVELTHVTKTIYMD